MVNLVVLHIKLYSDDPAGSAVHHNTATAWFPPDVRFVTDCPFQTYPRNDDRPAADTGSVTHMACPTRRAGFVACCVCLQDAEGNTLLHRAVFGEEDLPEYVAALVEAGVPVNAANKEHDAALHIAARQGHLEVGTRRLLMLADRVLQQCVFSLNALECQLAAKSWGWKT